MMKSILSLMETTMTNNNSQQNILVLIYDNLISILFWFILSFLALVSIKHTCLVDSYEITFFLKDKPLIHIALILILITVFTLLKYSSFIGSLEKRLETDSRFFKTLTGAGLLIIFFLSLYFIFSAKLAPVSDQLFVQEAAEAFSKGDYSSLEKGGYLAVYPNQLGLVWISYVFFSIFGFGNYQAFQIMNALFLVMFYKKLSDITGLVSPGKKLPTLSVILLGILFYPLQIYCTFVYGTIPGLALSAASVYYALTFQNELKKKDAILSALFILLAMLFKPNYLICFIGIFLHAVIGIFRKNSPASDSKTEAKTSIKKEVLFSALLITAFIVQSKLPGIVTSTVTKMDTPKGASSLSWIAMGFQESGLAEGWYNGYNIKTLHEFDFDSELQSEAAKEEIVSRLSYFVHNPHYSVEFFTRKLTSEWNDPTYEAYWILRTSNKSEDSSAWAKTFISYDNYLKGVGFLNFLQTFILIGALLFASSRLFAEKKVACLSVPIQSADILLEIILIGGFFFHLMWEAKSQYTLTYIALLLPLSIVGYHRFINAVTRASKQSLALFAVKMLIPVALFAFIYSGSIGSHMSEDNDAYLRTIERELSE